MTAERMTDGATASVGDLVGGRLRVVRERARGGMGVLFEAEDVVLERRVALKVMHGAFSSDPALRERLFREARAAAKLESPHVAHVLEVGSLPSGTPYVVLELLEGETVEAVLERDGLLPVDVAVDWFLQALDAVVEAHDAGLVHRDLKPGNLFVARTAATRIVKVLDFGLVRDVGDAGAASLTQTGESLGTPAYMAPEQIASARNADRRADVWALGVTLYEMLTGRMPFEATSIPGLFRRITRGAPVPIATWRSGLGEGLEAIIARCLERDPERRFPDARALRDAVLAARHAGTTSAPRIPATPGPSAPPANDTIPMTNAPPTPRRRRREPPGRAARRPWVVFAVACTTVLVAGAVAVPLVARRHATRTPETTAREPPAPTSTPVVEPPVVEPPLQEAAPDADVAPPPAEEEPAMRAAPAPPVASPRPPRARSKGTCRCVRPGFAKQPLCREFGPPYHCVDRGHNATLCRYPVEQGANCREGEWTTGPEWTRCEGFFGDRPRSGTFAARGPCTDDRYDGSPSSECFGRLSATTMPTSGYLVCDAK